MLLLALAALSPAVAGEDLGPPQEELLRSREDISSVLCRSPDRERMQRLLSRKYDGRLRAIREGVAEEFGVEAAGRDYITVQPCYFNRHDRYNRVAVASAIKKFESDLERWERRYDLHPASHH